MHRSQQSSQDVELARLLQRCAARDVLAFRALYDATSAVLFARLLRMLRRSPVAEEVLQDVYVRIWERAARYEAHRGRALAWMLTIARYCAIERLDRDRAVVESAHDSPTIETSGDDDVTHQSLVLAYVEGRSYGEIADLTMSPPDNARKRIRLGLLGLRDS